MKMAIDLAIDYDQPSRDKLDRELSEDRIQKDNSWPYNSVSFQRSSLSFKVTSCYDNKSLFIYTSVYSNKKNH